MIYKLSKKQEKYFTSYLFQQNFIAEGSGRKVYEWRNTWVIKVAKNKQGRRQNKFEVERFIKYGNKNLARIIAYSRKIIIMERVEPVEYKETEEQMKLVAWLDKICEQENLDHGDSLGLTKDRRLVCYDYGDSEKLFTKKLNNALSFREWLASQDFEEDDKND